MSDNTKLRPEDLTAEERALWDQIAVGAWLGHPAMMDGVNFADSFDAADRFILARRALFGTATEKAVDSCEKCGHVYGEKESGHLFRIDDDGTEHFSCQPAQPEPAAPVTGHTPIGEYDPDMKPAAPEMPEAVYIAANTLRASGHVTLADALLKEAWHSQPVAHPFKAGFKPDSMRHFAEYVRDNWHYFGTDTAGLAHQFVQEMAAQPVAVGMTEELKRVLEFASLRARILRDSHQGDSVAFGERMIAAIAAVRQQAAQVKL